ncbi:vomeronasal type-2 receptor 116-like [Peromyscus californicus insignis]|uniref:vomeronasal type-2 receptor 116-like n=1 Tax=Peromyscus californicus insignis TaxID=564181 RepID=UPI0022A8090B|nr:vomeronasal type-2 receptor 116-like [Peromyscus californicus insignis]
MTSWSFIHWILQIPPLMYAFEISECYFSIKDFRRDGNVMIGAFFPLHYYYTIKKIPHKFLPNYNEYFYLQYKFKNYQFVLALLFAIEEINRNPHLLPNTSLGFDLYNVPFIEKNTLMNAFIWLTGMNHFKVNYNCKKEQKSAAALTGTSFAISAHMGTLLQLYKIPQLTFGPFDTILSDRAQFTSLYQMAPNDTSLPLGIVSLMLHFKWTWVGLLLTDDHRGNQILSDLKEEMRKNMVCMAFVEMISGTLASFSDNFWKSVERIQDSSANVIIIYGDIDSLHGLVKNIGQKLTTGKVWVMNSPWDVTNHLDYFMLDSFHGSLIFSHYYEEMVDFTHFIETVHPSKYPEDTYLPKLWHLFFKCPFSRIDCKLLENCQPNASLNLLPKQNFDMAMSEESYYIYSAVYVVAHSLHEMILKQVQIQQYENGERIIFLPWQLHPSLQNIYMNNYVGSHTLMDIKSKLDSKYDIINFWNFPKGIGLKVKVGSFSPNAPHGQQLSLTTSLIQWPTRFTEIPKSVCYKLCGPGFRRTVQEGKAACCFDCTSCPYNEISNETDMDHCLKCPESHYANTEKNHCLQKTVTFLHYEDPLGMALSSIALCFSAITASVLGVFVKHRDTPIVKANNRALSYILLITLIICFLSSLLFIGQPNTATCILQQTTFGIAFTVALSTVLAKALTVVIAFKVTFPGRLMRWLMISRATNYVIPIFTLFQIILCGIWLGTSPPFVDQDAHAQHGHIIILCNKGSAIAFHCVLGYLCSLALGSYTMAFLSRNLPDKFNEAKFLTFSMLVFFSVWVTFLPVYHSTKGKVMVAMEVFAILASSAALVGFIFAPKCYIILLKPDKNVFHGIRDNTHYGRNKLN